VPPRAGVTGMINDPGTLMLFFYHLPDDDVEIEGETNSLSVCA